MNNFQFENLVKAVESCFKQNYCAMYFEDLYKKFSPEITETELWAAINYMGDTGKIELDGSLMRLIIR